MSSSVPRPLRIAAIDFLNPEPLMWDFTHPPRSRELAARYPMQRMTPSECARQLEQGAAEIGLIPIAGYASIPGLEILPGCTIASRGAIRSLQLISRAARPLEQTRTVAADTSSRTTVAYTRILFRRFWNPAAEFVPSAPDLDAMLARADAAVLIGDPALAALEHAGERERRTGERLVYTDLSLEWTGRMGVPWVSAFWAIRSAAVAGDDPYRETVRADFLDSRDHGLAHVPELVEEWAARLALPGALIRAYLTENIHYVLDEGCIEGIRVFYREAAALGILPGNPELRFF